MCSFFFWNDGIVLDCSVRSRKRTIFPQERRPALVQGTLGKIKFHELPCKVFVNNYQDAQSVNQETTKVYFLQDAY